MEKIIYFLSCFAGGLLIMVAMGHAEISINLDNENGNVEITGDGGVSRIGKVTGCVEGSGKEQTDVRPIGVFSEIIIDGIFEVTIDFKKESSLVIRGDDNILPLVSTEVKDQTLSIKATGSICPKRSLVVQISTEHLDRLTADGATDVTISNMDNNEFSAVVSGSGDLRVSGKTTTFSVKVDGAGTILAENLKAEETKVVIDGAGEASVYASKKLIGEIDGAGDIRYYGNPSEVKKKVEGAGEIEAQ